MPGLELYRLPDGRYLAVVPSFPGLFVEVVADTPEKAETLAIARARAEAADPLTFRPRLRAARAVVGWLVAAALAWAVYAEIAESGSAIPSSEKNVQDTARSGIVTSDRRGSDGSDGSIR